MNNLKTGEAGVALIKEFESCRLKAYQDGGGVWTCGWGSTGPDVTESAEWTQEYADARLVRDLLIAEKAVNQLVTVPLTQNEFDALVSFVFNVGSDIAADTKAEGLGDSTLLKLLNGYDYNGAAKEFVKWNKDNGHVVSGLTRRRNAEKALFETG